MLNQRRLLNQQSLLALYSGLELNYSWVLKDLLEALLLLTLLDLRNNGFLLLDLFCVSGLFPYGAQLVFSSVVLILVSIDSLFICCLDELKSFCGRLGLLLGQYPRPIVFIEKVKSRLGGLRLG